MYDYIEEVHVGDVGVQIIAIFHNPVNSIMDVSSFTTLQLIFTKPDTTQVTQTATFVNSGTDGQIQYVTQTGDLSLAGLWQIQGFIQKIGAQLHSNVGKFTVYPNLV